jgi:hypothetical protein
MNSYLLRRIALAAFFGLMYSVMLAQQFCRLPGETPQTQGSSGSASFETFVRRFASRGGHVDPTVKTIPVVVHVLYREPADSLSAERVESQIEAFNRDFRRLNADTSKTRAAFAPVAADLHLEFCLAQRDPAGQPSNGITYTWLPGDGLDSLQTLRLQTQWAPQRYLNLWVVPGFGGGVSSFPWELGQPGVIDGIVVETRRFGTVGALDGGFEEGGIGTHEVGHYLGLYHTFEGGFAFLGQCLTPCDSTGDYVCDTPLDWTLPFTTEQCDLGERSCDDVVDSVFLVQNENFMAYSYDTCTNMFTYGQRIRVLATLDSLRAELVSEANLIATGCDATTGLPAGPPAFAVRLFPHPAGTTVTVDLGSMAAHTTVRVLTSDGRQILERRSREAIRTELDVSALPGGLYFVVIEIPAGRLVKKLVVGR